MSDARASLPAPIDAESGGLLLANMLESWLQGPASFLAPAEVVDELEDHRTPPEQTRLHLSPPVDPGPSASPSGEHRAPVCPAREGAGTRLERSGDPYPRPGPGCVGGPDGGAG